MAYFGMALDNGRVLIPRHDLDCIDGVHGLEFTRLLDVSAFETLILLYVETCLRRDTICDFHIFQYIILFKMLLSLTQSCTRLSLKA